MTVNRDLAAIVLSKWPRPLRSVLDGLAATGAWGIRMKLEARLDRIVFNDRSVLAADLIRENLRANRISGDVRTGDFGRVLKSERYDFVDIDPFGPPTPFLGPLLERASAGSGVGITATDTAVLEGTYPEACGRRYDARPMRCPQGPEVGLRILLGYCQRSAMENGLSIRPLLSFSAEHFLRVLAVLEGDKEAPFLASVTRRRGGEFVRAHRGDAEAIGPLWIGPLHDPAFIRRLTPNRWTTPQAARLLSTLQGEADLPPFFVTTDELAAVEHGSPPKLAAFIDALRDRGHRATRTHFHPRGVRTDAPFDEVQSVFRERMPSGSTDGSEPAS
jgi:tRNA (guanine26-N2/guanine27-N2)-dimethyltransferase